MTPTNNNFGKEKHLKSRKQIDQLFTGGKAFFVHPIKVFWRLEGELQTTDDGRPTTDKIQVEMQTTDDGRQTTDKIQVEMQTTDDGRPTTDKIQVEMQTTDDGRQTTDKIQVEMQTTDDGRQTTDEIQLADDRRKQTGDSQNIAEKSPKSKIENQSSPISRLSSVVGHRSSVVGHRSSVIGRPSSVVGRPSSAVSIGVSASKRNFKKAVDRNRVKRLLREAYRLSQHDLQQAMTGKNASLQVFFIFVDKTIPTFALVQEKMLICLKRLQKIAGEAKNEKLL